MWWILSSVAAFIASYWLIIRPYKYWTKKGVKQGKTTYFFGASWGIATKRQSFAQMVKMVYKACPDVRYSGFYQFFRPTLVIRDPELIKQIGVKDFDHFVDHPTVIPEESDPLWAGNLVALTGQKWRDMRITLSPAFTSNKMKYMFPLISQNGEQFVNYFLDKKENVVTLEMKDTYTRYSNDVIANTAFGVECNSLRDRSNEFYVMGKDATDFSGFWKTMKFLGYLLFPKLYRIIKIPLISKKMRDFFNRLVKGNIESREKHGIERPDMIHLLLQARKNNLKHEENQPNQDTGFATVKEFLVDKDKTPKTQITDQVITSQALIFFFAGFETVSSLLCFMSHELAVNPEIQQKLIEEVDRTRKGCNGKLTYEALFSMKYMDLVVSECLRKWPVAAGTDRICTKPYRIEPKYPHEKLLTLEKNSLVLIPIFGLHRDPQYYPNPERFDPERFCDENKGKIIPYTYIPFGVGPRNCIGCRFALMETKSLVFYILSHFEIVPVAKTKIPLKICRKQFNMTAEGGFWLGLKRRITE